MKDLIAALTILAKYLPKDEYSYSYPTHCEHDQLMVPGVDVDKVSPQDMERLSELGFKPHEDGLDGFVSYRFGSC